jgi:hypothetical protein
VHFPQKQRHGQNATSTKDNLTCSVIHREQVGGASNSILTVRQSSRSFVTARRVAQEFTTSWEAMTIRIF